MRMELNKSNFIQRLKSLVEPSLFKEFEDYVYNNYYEIEEESNGYFLHIKGKAFKLDPTDILTFRSIKVTNTTSYSDTLLTLFNNQLKDELKSRYCTDRIRIDSPTQNVIVDQVLFNSFILPFQDYCIDSYISSIKNKFTISKYFSTKFNIPQLPLTEQIKLLGYNIKEIKSWFKQAKNKNLNMVVAGIGGIGFNTLEYLTLLCEEFNIKNLFKKILIYEQDTIEISNIYRFNTDRTFTNFKYNGISNYITKYTGSIHKISLLDQDKLQKLSKNKMNYIDHKIYNGYGFNSPNTFIYGAPDCELREKLTNTPFLCASHSGNVVELKSAPHADHHIQVESYGLINIPIFLLNVLDITIQLIKTLALHNPVEFKGERKVWYENEFNLDKQKTSKTYNIPIYSSRIGE